jgi:RHS repeat-associated protein
MLVRGVAGCGNRGRRGWSLRWAALRVRRVCAVALGPVVAAGTSLVPAAVAVTAVTASAAAVAVAHAAPAAAATSPTALVLLQAGETTAPETTVLRAAGYTVTQDTPAQWAAASTATFQGFNVLVMGDPSQGGTCSSLLPVTGTAGSNQESVGTAWQAAVNGNIAVTGTAPALPGTSGANSLITDAVGWAAQQPATGSVTGLYVSLNCEYKTAAAGTAVPLLDGVEGIGTTGSLTVNGSLACTDTGTVNAQAAQAAGTFGGFTSASLGTGSTGFPSPACPVQEAFDTWPATFTAAGYDAASDAAKNFTASDGVTGQPYVLLGAPPAPAGTLALSPATGGQVPYGTEAGGSNAAAPGADQALAAGGQVNTFSGDLTTSHTDLSIPTFGPGLAFSRSYDAQLAQQQEQTGTPGPMGYGWSDNWQQSLTATVTKTAPVPGDIYALDGLAGAVNTGDGLTAYAANGQAPGAAPLGQPGGVLSSGGNVFYSDSQGNRVIEVPAATGTQFGISMTAGQAYVIAGSYTGLLSRWNDLNGAGTSQLLFDPTGLAMDSAGDLFIANTGGQQVDKLSVSGNLTTVAGTGSGGTGADGVTAASSALDNPVSVSVDAAGDVYIADSGNNRIQEVFASGGSNWGQAMTAGDIYTVAGSAAGTAGRSANGTAGGSSLLRNPQGITVNGNGALFIADTGNNRVAQIPPTNGTRWGISMTGGDIYDVAGSAAGTAGHTGDGSSAWGTALLSGPQSVTQDSAGDMVIADTGNSRVQFVPTSGATYWGQPMSTDDMYTIAGSSAGTAGNSGNGGLATSALLNAPAYAASVSGKLWITDTGNDTVRSVDGTSLDITGYAGSGQDLASAGNGGPAVNGQLEIPSGEVADSHGDLYIADGQDNRVQEIAAYSHVQWGITMTGGDVYTIAGSATGAQGNSGDGGAATSALLNQPNGLAFDPAGNLLIADFGNNQVRMVAATAGTFYGSARTANDIYTIAGSTAGTAGTGSDGVAASSGLLNRPSGLAADANGDVYIADKDNNRIQEIFAAGGQSWGHAMTAGDVYTVAGSAAGTAGNSGDGGAATAAKLDGPLGVATDGSGDLLIADTTNEQVRIVAVASGKLWGVQMTARDIYTLAGSTGGTAGYAGDGGPAGKSQLHSPNDLAVDPAGDIYIADGANDVIREIAAASGTAWGTQQTAGDIYTIAGKAGTASSTGDGGPASMATIYYAVSSKADSYGDLYIGDQSGGQLREVPSATPATIAPSPAVTYPSALYPPPGSTINGTTYPAGITVAQPGGATVTFYPQGTGGTCNSPMTAAGGYCVMPVDTGAALAAIGTTSWTFTPAPGADSDTYSQVTGQLTSIADTAGNTLAITYTSPAPGQATTGTSTPITCPATAHSCDTITSASGRALVIGFDTSGRVSSVTDPAGRAWTYTYSSFGDLAAATDPMGNLTTYTYNTGNASPLLQADLLTVTTPNGQAGGPDAGAHTSYGWDSSGRVISQTDPMGYKTTINYCVTPAAGDCLNATTGTGFVTVTDPDGNATVDDYDHGTLTAQTDWTGATGTALTSEDDQVPDTSEDGTLAAGTLLDTATADGNGNTTIYTYTSSGNPASTTTPSPAGGTATTTTGYTSTLQDQSCTSTAEAAATCSSNPGPAPVTHGGGITPPGSAPPSGLTWTQYDDLGNELYRTTGVYSPSGTLTATRTTYQLFKNNSITLNGTNVTCTASPPSPSLPCATINADGVVTQLAYDGQGDLSSSSTRDGNAGGELAVTSYTYDADGEKADTVAPDGNLTGANAGNYTTHNSWNADGQLITITQGGGTGYTDTPRVSYYGFDADGNQVTAKDPRGFTTITSYNAGDQGTLVTNQDGNAALTCYDGDGNAAQTIPATGVAANTLTAASCPSVYPAGYGTRLASDATVSTFDAAGNVTQQTSPAPAGQTGSETTSYTYDGDGNLLTTTGPPTSNGGSSQVTTNTYDNGEKLASQTTGSGTSAASTVSYCYDPNGDKTSVIYADGNTGGTATCSISSPWTVTATPQATYQTTYSYDSVRELVSTTTPKTAAAPNGATTNSSYDAAGNMITRTDPNGVTTTWTYTPLNQPSTVSYSGSSAHSVTYSNDANGYRIGMTDATGTSSYVYDPFGELTSAQNGAGQVTGYGYNADGQVSSITYPLPSTATWATSDTVSYGYDNADQLNSVTDFNGHQISIGDTADGLPNSVTLGSTGDTVTTSYGTTDMPSSITLKNSSSTLQSFTYTDAPSGNILNETDTPASSQSPAVYTYDAKGRVTSDTPGAGSTNNYGFDATGNLTKLPTGGTGTYDSAGEISSQTQSGTTTSYTYNADGEQLTATQGSTTVSQGTWNGAGQLATYNDAAANMTAATYDGNNLRASTTVTPSGGSALTQGYVWNRVSQVPELITDGADAYIYDGGLAPAEQVSLSSGTVTYLVNDSLGSVRGIVNSTGTLTGTTSYDAWGNPQTIGGLTATTPFGYAGGYTDPTGLIYLLSRYYNPSTGQFPSVDPILITTAIPYLYANGNPVSNSDPTGNSPCLSKARAWVSDYYYRYNHDVNFGAPDCLVYGGLMFVGGAAAVAAVIMGFIPFIGWAAAGIFATIVGGLLGALTAFAAYCDIFGPGHGLRITGHKDYYRTPMWDRSWSAGCW